jgi:hypothetical protein
MRLTAGKNAVLGKDFFSGSKYPIGIVKQKKDTDYETLFT